MMMVVQRERRVESRRWLSYWSRFIAAAVATWILGMNYDSVRAGDGFGGISKTPFWRKFVGIDERRFPLL